MRSYSNGATSLVCHTSADLCHITLKCAISGQLNTTDRLVTVLVQIHKHLQTHSNRCTHSYTYLSKGLKMGSFQICFQIICWKFVTDFITPKLVALVSARI